MGKIFLKVAFRVLKKYWEGNGVTVEGVYALRRALNGAGHENVGITLSSGFSNPEKVKAFNDGEKKYGVKLYDAIGAGFLDGPRTFTADIIAVGETAEEVDFYSNEIQSKKYFTQSWSSSEIK